MVFNSVEFFVLLAIVLPVYFCVRLRVQNALLLVASYVFYGFWDWRFLSLIFVSTMVDYAIGRQLGGSTDDRRRKLLVITSVAVNIGILGFFKYAGFFVDSFAIMLESFGFDVHLPTLQIVLPVGISFYTFQTLSYTIDVYRRKMEPTRDLLTFALFVAFFPQLVAGPIERAKHLLPILANKRIVSWKNIAVGLELILLGFVKKVAVADTLAPLVDARYMDPSAASGSDLLLATYLFSIQIYCDFSGYSDIARGSARLFGIKLMRNFEQPYLSSSITEFWRRWHISLSSWLRDYVYISFGGNRLGQWMTYRNLMLTMLLGGLWHGASWTFVIWGGLHGLYLGVHKFFRGASAGSGTSGSRLMLRKLASIFITFQLVTFTWIFFRAGSLADAMAVIAGIGQWQAGSGLLTPLSWLSPRLLILVSCVLLIDWYQARSTYHAFMVGWPAWRRTLAYTVLLGIILVLGNLSGDVPFIYFQF